MPNTPAPDQLARQAERELKAVANIHNDIAGKTRGEWGIGSGKSKVESGKFDLNSPLSTFDF